MSHYIHGTDAEEQQRLTRLNALLNEATLREARLAAGERVIDFGAGLGQFSRAMARVTGRTVVGIERSAEQIREAMAQASRGGGSEAARSAAGQRRRAAARRRRVGDVRRGARALSARARPRSAGRRADDGSRRAAGRPHHPRRRRSRCVAAVARAAGPRHRVARVSAQLRSSRQRSDRRPAARAAPAPGGRAAAAQHVDLLRQLRRATPTSPASSPTSPASLAGALRRDRRDRGAARTGRRPRSKRSSPGASVPTPRSGLRWPGPKASAPSTKSAKRTGVSAHESGTKTPVPYGIRTILPCAPGASTASWCAWARRRAAARGRRPGCSVPVRSAAVTPASARARFGRRHVRQRRCR